MLTYTVEGQTLIIVSIGTTPSETRRQIYEAMAHDPIVPRGVDLLIDVRRGAAAPSLTEVEARTRRLRLVLGPKLSGACAVIVPPRIRPEAVHFRIIGRPMGLHVEIFADEPQARTWLGQRRQEGK